MSSQQKRILKDAAFLRRIYQERTDFFKPTIKVSFLSFSKFPGVCYWVCVR